jgi:type I restriction enzyme, S subunit
VEGEDGMSEWQESSLKQLIARNKIVIGDGYRAKNEELSAQGLPFARAGNINNGFHFEGADCLPLADIKKVGNKISQPCDIVFTSKGTVGRFAYVNNDTQQFVYSPQLCFWRSLDHFYIDSRWLYFWMNGREFWEQVHSLKDQTDMADYVNLNDQRNMAITLPPLPEQRAIASVLSSLDDKIDLLHRQNKTLEAMAETLFRQWFVEEAGEGEMTTLGEYAINVRQNARVDDLVKYNHYVGLEHIPRKCITLSGWGDTDKLVSNKSIFEANDILFGKLRSYFHKVVFAPIDGVCSTDILVIRPKKAEWFSFCLLNFFSKDVVDHSDLGSEGTRMPRTNWDIISSYQIARPDEQTLQEFDAIVRPMVNKMSCNIFQIQKLEQLRDTLLPKLMSGEVRVNNV